MIMGIDSYVALSDFYGVNPREAKEFWRWVCKALIRAAAAEADGSSRSGTSVVLPPRRLFGAPQCDHTLN